MKLGIYSCMAPDLPAERIAAVLQEAGCACVEWTIGYRNAVWDPASQWHIREDRLEEDVPRFRDLCAAHGLEIVALGGNVSLFEPERLRVLFGAAAALACPQVRIFSVAYNCAHPFPQLFRDARAALPEVARVSAETGVKALLEIHMGTIIPSASAAYRLVEGLDPARVGILFDPGNMVHEGYEQWRMGAEILGPYLAHVHVKNYGWVRGEGGWKPEPAALDAGLVDYARVVAALRAVGYQGALCMEDFRGGYGCVPVGITSEEKIHEDIRYMRSLLA